ncbi:hypothetical protein F900_02198 [Acinetobacter modestus]|uniref:Threonine transporter n=1 Tax=Acinetobacter modestus TaxID=1776740 RepID=N9LWB1_9GAMM|nr:ABC-three component system middle component 2 [Acinetobacter modestus]ENX00524.1 hypothetical protein F900_02198 [Acinetobacter modestus]
MENLIEKSLFNNPLEVGFRSLILLDAFYPNKMDLTYLTWFDHLIVNTADFGGDISLHPKIPFRIGGILVRRKLVQDGLELMQSLNLISAVNDESGFYYQASDESNFIVDLISSEYGTELKERASWLFNNFSDLSREEISQIIEKNLGRWSIEFLEAKQIDLNGF